MSSRNEIDSLMKCVSKYLPSPLQILPLIVSMTWLNKRYDNDLVISALLGRRANQNRGSLMRNERSVTCGVRRECRPKRTKPSAADLLLLILASKAD